VKWWKHHTLENNNKSKKYRIWILSDFSVSPQNVNILSRTQRFQLLSKRVVLGPEKIHEFKANFSVSKIIITKQNPTNLSWFLCYRRHQYYGFTEEISKVKICFAFNWACEIQKSPHPCTAILGNLRTFDQKTTDKPNVLVHDCNATLRKLIREDSKIMTSQDSIAWLHNETLCHKKKLKRLAGVVGYTKFLLSYSKALSSNFNTKTKKFKILFLFFLILVFQIQREHIEFFLKYTTNSDIQISHKYVHAEPMHVHMYLHIHNYIFCSFGEVN
jgi:hypothetical protein